MATIELKQIKEARERIAPYIRKTPLLPFDFLSNQLKKEIWLKCETLQRTGSFKIRGAANCILSHLPQAKKSGVIAASAGNHAQGVAAICSLLGIRATIVMPVITPPLKILNTQRWGASVELVGDIYDESYEHAKKIAQEKGLLFIHPYKDPLVMAGQGTLALEMAEDPIFEELEAVICPVGGGGLVSGVGVALKALKPDIKLYGVSAKNAPALWKSYHDEKLVQTEIAYTLAEGVAAKRADEQMLKNVSELVDDYFAMGEEAIAHAIALLAEQEKVISEGAGALPLAALLERQIPEKKVALILSGGNVDLTTLSHVLERGLLEQGRLVRLLITVPDRPGSLHKITQVLAEQRANILQVFHQRATLHAGMGEAEVEVDVETRGKEHTEQILSGLQKQGFRVQRVS